MSPRSASHRPRHDWKALRDVSPTQGWISDPHLPSSALHGSHCLSRDFTRSAKPALEKQTSQLSPVMHQCMDSAWVWLLAGPIKCNWPSVTLWSVFQYPVTYSYATRHHACTILLLVISINLMEANLATFALYSGVNFMYGRFFCGSLASATAFKTSLLRQSGGPLIHGTDRTGPDQIHTLFYGTDRTMNAEFKRMRQVCCHIGMESVTSAREGSAWVLDFKNRKQVWSREYIFYCCVVYHIQGMDVEEYVPIMVVLSLYGLLS